MRAYTMYLLYYYILLLSSCVPAAVATRWHYCRCPLCHFGCTIAEWLQVERTVIVMGTAVTGCLRYGAFRDCWNYLTV